MRVNVRIDEGRALLLLLVHWWVLAAGCGRDGPGTEPPADDLEIRPPTSAADTVLGPGTSLQLTITDVQGEAVDGTISWSSSDPSVVVVSNSGLVTAVGPGEAVVSATVSGRSGTVDQRFVVDQALTEAPWLQWFPANPCEDFPESGCTSATPALLAGYTGHTYKAYAGLIVLHNPPANTIPEQFSVTSALAPCQGPATGCLGIGSPSVSRGPAPDTFVACFNVTTGSTVPLDILVRPQPGGNAWTISYQNFSQGGIGAQIGTTFAVYTFEGGFYFPGELDEEPCI